MKFNPTCFTVVDTEGNLEDCFGNSAPACGGCLWAQGLVQCPCGEFRIPK